MTLPLFPPTPMDELCRIAREWVCNPRRRGDTWLVTKGHILKPEFRVQCQVKGDLLELTIAGSNDSLKVQCNRVVQSKFRPDQIGFFVVDADGVVRDRKALAFFGRAYQLILEAFPPNSKFSSQELYRRVTRSDGESQRHARRRWRELKLNFGFDVDSDQRGNVYWRGSNELPIGDPHLRPDDKKLREEYWELLASKSQDMHKDDLPHCESCDGRVISKDEKDPGIEFDDLGLLDHRRPVLQGGGDDPDNLQIFCQTCNNKKNSVCTDCSFGFRCDDCVWAYPEKSRSRRLVLHLDPKTAEILRALLGSSDLESQIVRVLRELASERKVEI